MAKDFTMRNYNGTGYDVLHPATSMGQVEGLSSKISEVEAVAAGASRAKVFETLDELNTWLAVPNNKSKLSAGDNFYIRDLEVPDYWWDGTDIQPLSTEKVVVNNATESADGLMAKDDKRKLDEVEAGANKYVHPSSHPADLIIQDVSNRFVTDTEKASWSNKADKTVATASMDGLMSSEDKARLDSAPVITVSEIEPANIKVGDIWYDTSGN